MTIRMKSLQTPEIVVDTEKFSIEQCRRQILDYLIARDAVTMG